MPLPSQGEVFPGGTASLIAGWGNFDEGTTNPMELHYVNTQIVDDQQCVEDYQDFFVQVRIIYV